MNCLLLKALSSVDASRILASPASRTGITWSPDVDVIESAGGLVARIDLPGVQMSDVAIEITEDGLTVSGKRRREPHHADDNWQVAERAYGHFFRTILLPARARVELAQATFGDGVLEIVVPATISEIHDMSMPTFKKAMLQISAKGSVDCGA